MCIYDIDIQLVAGKIVREMSLKVGQGGNPASSTSYRYPDQITRIVNSLV